MTQTITTNLYEYFIGYIVIKSAATLLAVFIHSSFKCQIQEMDDNDDIFDISAEKETSNCIIVLILLKLYFHFHWIACLLKVEDII